MDFLCVQFQFTTKHKKKIEERQELARLFSKNAFEQLHNWQPTTKDGKIAKSIAHGIIGEVAARMAGNTPGSGFKATMTNELLIDEIKKVAKYDPALAQWLSAAVGGMVNKASGKNANVGAAVSSYATKWNEFQNEPKLFNELEKIQKNNYIVNYQGQSFDLRAMPDGVSYVISVKDEITGKYKNIAINNKLELFDLEYEDGGTTSGLTDIYFSESSIGSVYEPTTYKALNLLSPSLSSGSTKKTRKFVVTDYDGNIHSVLSDGRQPLGAAKRYFYKFKNLINRIFSKSQHGNDGITTEYKEALDAKARGYEPRWSMETGEFSIDGKTIPISFLSYDEILKAQYLALGNHSDELDLNSRWGPSNNQAAIRGLVSKNNPKQSLTRITDGTHMETVDGIRVLKPNVEYIKNGYTYHTDADRNITKVFGIIELNDAKRIPSAQKAIVEQTGIPGEDHGGHLIAKIFNGSGDIDNLVAMDRVVNQSEYRKIENAIKKAVMEGNVVSVEIEVIRNGGKRPSGFEFSYSINGERSVTKTIPNN